MCIYTYSIEIFTYIYIYVLRLWMFVTSVKCLFEVRESLDTFVKNRSNHIWGGGHARGPWLNL